MESYNTNKEELDEKKKSKLSKFLTIFVSLLVILTLIGYLTEREVPFEQTKAIDSTQNY
jgi:heme/copper-type cytochrome/quinol oxidase subunit 4